MKNIFTFSLILFFSFASFGQLPSDFIAPDFTVTDLDGEEHNLYEILDEGKTVIVDIYATWCAPCWTFHSDHVLADIWEELGPNGTDEVFIMSIESDLSTDMNDINGTGANTQGNWIDGTPYPMIDEMEGSDGVGQIAQDYFVTGYPTIYFICPDRSVTQLNWQEVQANYLNEIGSCPTATGDLNCRLVEYTGVEGVVCFGENFTPKVSFQNRGNQAVTSATFGFTINGSTEEVVWEGNLNTFSFGEVEFSNVEVSNNTDVIIELIDVNNNPDETPDDNTIETSILAPPTTEMDTITVEIMTDLFGEETYWVVLNENDEIMDTGGNQVIGLDSTIESTGGTFPAPSDSTAYEGNTLYSTDVYVPESGCYRLLIADYYQDGFCCLFGNGYFKVISQDNIVLVDGTGIVFGASIESQFAYNKLVRAEDQIFSDLKIFPNPIINILTIEFPENISEVQTINVFDMQGRMIINNTSVNEIGGQISLDLSTIHSGLYVLQVNLKDGRFAQRRFFKG